MRPVGRPELPSYLVGLAFTRCGVHPPAMSDPTVSLNNPVVTRLELELIASGQLLRACHRKIGERHSARSHPKGQQLTSFAELNLIGPLERAIADERYETPTPIQAQTIPAALAGRDILGCAQTGTGKTAAFALPILNRLGKQNRRSEPNRPRVLVLAPTRELAIQIGESFATYGKHLKLRHVLVYGGVNQFQQVRSLKRGAHVVVATPGRLLDLMNQGHIKLDGLEVFVLDEADRMLDMGFLPDLKRIIAQLPDERQSLFFSATLSPDIVRLTRGLLSDPVSVDVTPPARTLDTIEQRVLFIQQSQKRELLKKILSADDVERALVFTRTKRGANVVVQHLSRSGINATAIHGNKSQNARQKALDSFRRGHVKVLVATDLAARGIDVDGITHVVNFELPNDPESYVHRIGRTGRAGATGIALTFCSSSERSGLRAIERLIGMKVPVDGEHPPQGEDEEQSSPRPYRRQRPHGQGAHFSGPGRRKPGQPRGGAPATASDGEKPKRRRRNRRKGARGQAVKS